MDAGSGNVITTLRDRWSIEQELQAILDIRSEQAFSDRARRVAASGEQVIPALLAQLDHAEARFVGVLGVVASLYPDRQAIIDKLYQAAEDETRSDRSRVSAILILERFLEQETDPYLLETLDDPQFMAVESIREMIREGEHDPRAWVEYTRSLIDQPPEMIWDVMETLLEIGGERAVPALCLLAQEESEVISEAAMHTLGRINHPNAARGVQSILPLLPPERRALAQRSLLKLQLKQVSIAEPPDPQGRWRTLVGPPDGHGYQVVWFVHAPDKEERRQLLGLSIHEQTGIQSAYGHHDVSPDMVPQRRALGQVHSVLLPGTSDGNQPGARLLMLETDLAYGRRLVREGHDRTFAAGQPFPIEYRLMGPWLWQYREGESEPQAGTALLADAGARDSADLRESAGLLYHPAFRSWFADGEQMLEEAAALLRRLPKDASRVSRGWSLPPDELSDLVRRNFDPTMVKRLQGRLTGMHEWLERAGEKRAARLALAAAGALAERPPDQHPFTRAMVELGLQILVEQLRSLY